MSVSGYYSDTLPSSKDTIIPISKNQLLSTETQWYYVGKNLENVKWYIRSDGIVLVNHLIKVWVKSVEPILKFNGHSYKNAIIYMHYLFDCSAKIYRVISIYAYTSKNDFLFKHDMDEQANTDFMDCPPGSVSEMLLNKACALYNK